MSLASLPLPLAASLQAWLEAAWAAGYDRMGAESLGGDVQVGSTGTRYMPAL